EQVCHVSTWICSQLVLHNIRRWLDKRYGQETWTEPLPHLYRLIHLSIHLLPTLSLT
ncbi:hypothetical protein IRJ41_011688, partial [Triplophysa rosa]